MGKRLVQIKMATLYFSKFTFLGSNSHLTVIKHSVSCHINLSAIKLENYFSPTLKWGVDILPKNCLNLATKFGRVKSPAGSLFSGKVPEYKLPEFKM